MKNTVSASRQNTETGFIPGISVLLKSVAAALISAAVLLLIFSGIAYSTADPDSLVVPLSIAALYISAGVCGLVGAKLSDGGILNGLISGIAFLAVILLLSFIPNENGYIGGWLSVLLHALIPVAGAVGGFIGTRRSSGAKNARKRMKKQRR